jgi:prenyltransferase beta subunit
MRSRAAILLIVGIAVGVPAVTVAAAGARSSPSPVSYLQAGPATNSLYVSWAMMGLESAGTRPNGRLVTYLKAHEGPDAGSLERDILALAPIGQPVAALADRLQRDIRADGSIDNEMTLTTFAVMALRAAGRNVSTKTGDWLAAQQDRDGGYSWDEAGDGSDVDDSGAALEGLAVARGEGIAIPGLTARIKRAVSFIYAQQNRDGGMPSMPGGPSNSQSTAWAIQGLIAIGRDPVKAQTYLRARISPNGAINYAKDEPITPMWVTGQALMGLTGRPLPLPRLR